MLRLTRCTVVVLAGIALWSARLAIADDFKPPADGKFTEDQLNNYIAVMSDDMKAAKNAGQAAQGTQSTAAQWAIMSHVTKQMQDALAAHHMTSSEYDWMGTQVGKLWPTALLRYQWEQNGKPDLEKQIKAKEEDEAAARQKLATYQKAQADGVRVLSKDQRDSAISSATSDRDSAAQQVKDAEANIKSIQDEIAQHQKEADDAAALAKNPPADVSADDRQSYIDGKNNDAQTARDAVKDSQAKLPDAEKSLTDAKAALAVAEAKLAHPEAPATDDEKAQAKQENEQAIADAKSAIDNDQQAIGVLRDTLSAGPPKLDPSIPVDDDNLQLVQKHLKELFTAMGAPEMLDKK